MKLSASAAQRTLTVVVTPGNRLYADMIGACRFQVVGGGSDTPEQETTSQQVLIGPYLAVTVLRLRGRLQPLIAGRSVTLATDLLYDHASLAPTPATKTLVHVTGAGISMVRPASAASRLHVRLRRAGLVRVWATVGAIRSGNVFTLHVRPK